MRIQNVSPLFTRPGLDLIVELYRTNQPTFYQQMVSEEDTKGYFFRIGTESDFLAATITNEATGVLYQDFLTPYFRDIYHYKRSVGFASSTESMESDYYGVIAKKMPKMTRSVLKAVEMDIAGFMNLATSTVTTGPNSVVTPDGIALASAAHLLDTGTGSNIISGNPALSISSLETGIQSLMSQPSATGEPEMLTGPFTLWVHPAVAGLANRLTTSQAQPQGNDNDPNWARTHVNRVVVNPWFTSTTAWMLVSQGDLNPFKMLNRRKPTFKSQEDIDKDVIKNVLTQIWSKFPKDWRGLAFSAGA